MTDQERFATTNWSLIRAAGKSHTESSRFALEQLFRLYWFPMYAYVRRRGRDESEARDLVQSFVTTLLQRNDFADVGPDKGKFRTFLLKSLQNFLANDYKRNMAQKRGGGATMFSIDFAHAEHRLPEPSTHQSPEKIFEKEWGLSLIRQTLEDLRCEYRTAQKEHLFDQLSVYLTGDTGSSESYQMIAQRMNMSESAVKSAVYRMRHAYRNLLRNHIAQTVTSDDEIDDEIRQLFLAVTN